MESDDNNENYDDNDDNMALMQEHLANVHLHENKKQLYGEIQLDQGRQQHQYVMPLLPLTPVQLTQPTHTEEKLNDDDDLSDFVTLPDEDMHDYHFEQAWTDGTTAVATQPHLARVLVQAQKKYYDCQRG